MSTEHIILIVVSFVGLLQAVMLFVLNSGMSKIQRLCDCINDIERELGKKADINTSDARAEKLELRLGKIGDRILKLELNVIPKIIEEED